MSRCLLILPCPSSPAPPDPQPQPQPLSYVGPPLQTRRRGVLQDPLLPRMFPPEGSPEAAQAATLCAEALARERVALQAGTYVPPPGRRLQPTADTPLCIRGVALVRPAGVRGVCSVGSSAGSCWRQPLCTPASCAGLQLPPACVMSSARHCPACLPLGRTSSWTTSCCPWCTPCASTCSTTAATARASKS